MERGKRAGDLEQKGGAVMGIFGWSYPPGCSGPPDDFDGPCEICGEMFDNCECLECPVCESIGDPRCYLEHGMRRTEEQKFNLEVNERLWEEENWGRSDAMYSLYVDDIEREY